MTQLKQRLSGAGAQNAAWRWNRLRTMSPAEMLWRGSRLLRGRLDSMLETGLRQWTDSPPPNTQAELEAPYWFAFSCRHSATPQMEASIPGADAGTGSADTHRAMPPKSIAAQRYVEAADRVLEGRFDVFALEDIRPGFPPEWNRDPKTGIQSPMCRGDRLDYRDEQLVGDIKYLWELNRHQELVTLAQAYALERHPRHARGCRQLLDSWISQCPWPIGQGWCSALENALRLLNWSLAWQLLLGSDRDVFADSDGVRLRRRWLDSIHRHCGFIAANLSQYSSANNHLFGEYLGLYIGASLWPCWKESRTWKSLAWHGLSREALKQNAPDGVNREQGIWYHHEVADMMLLAGLAARANGEDFPDVWWQRLERMLEFIDSAMDVAGQVPAIGDADDAVMGRLSLAADHNPWQALLAAGAVLFGRVDFKDRCGQFHDRNRWLMGHAGEQAFHSLGSDREEYAAASTGFQTSEPMAYVRGSGPRLPSASARPSAVTLDNPQAPALRAEPRRAFPDGGYYLLGHRFGMPGEIRIIADAGPLGYLAIAAHGHADALAFTLSAGGSELLVDSGTYAYHTQPRWRAYFRGTQAHNTVCVDGVDQSVAGGNFMWIRQASARCVLWESTDERDCFVGFHDGYQRLADPVGHTRKLIFTRQDQHLLVEDTLTCRKEHRVEFNWHFHPACSVSVHEQVVSVRAARALMEMSMPGGGLCLKVIRGQDEPPRGWISRRFDRKEASPTVVWNGRIEGTETFRTLIRLWTGP